jgi:hypothetical protein
VLGLQLQSWQLLAAVLRSAVQAALRPSHCSCCQKSLLTNPVAVAAGVLQSKVPPLRPSDQTRSEEQVLLVLLLVVVLLLLGQLSPLGTSPQAKRQL